MQKPKIVSIRENPIIVDDAITYFQKHWANTNSMMVYDNCIRNCINAKASLPQWYLLVYDDKTIGCAGLITNDFISRMIYFRGFVPSILKKNTGETAMVLFCWKRLSRTVQKSDLATCISQQTI